MSNTISLKEMSPVIKEVISAGGKVRVVASGNSMHPVIRDGIDIVVLKKSEHPVKKGDIVLFQRENGKLVLHRIIKACENHFVLRGDSQWTAERISESSVVACLDSIERNGKTYSQDGFYFKKYKILLPFIRWTKRIINSVKIRLGVNKNDKYS